MAEQSSVPPNLLKKLFERKNEHLIVTGYVTSDRLQLLVDCRKVLSTDPYVNTDEDLCGLLAIASSMLDREAVAALVREVNEGKSVELRRVARGIAPEDGKDGHIEYFFKNFHPIKREAKTADAKAKEARVEQQVEQKGLHSVHFFDNVEKGAVVAKVYAPVAGKDGIDVFGNPIDFKPGKPVKFYTDRSVSVKPAEKAAEPHEVVTAETAGYFLEEGGKISIKEELSIPGDVGFRTGDIDFVGRVKVEEDVMKDFHVTARKEIEIGGNSVHATIVSQQGSIKVGGSAYGAVAGMKAEQSSAARVSMSSAKAQLRCPGVFRAATVQGTSVESGSDVEIAKEASNSVIRARGILKMKDGHLFGCTVYVVCGVDAKIIGTRLGSPTEIHFCSELELSPEFQDVTAELESIESSESTLKLHLGPMAEKPGLISKLPQAQREKMNAMYEKYAGVKRRMIELQKKRDELLKTSKSATVLRVSFHETMFKGTRIVFGDRSFAPEADIPGPKTVEFNMETKAFDVGGLKAVLAPGAVEKKPHASSAAAPHKYTR